MSAAPQGRASRATIGHVAKVAGVSRATVSRALNDSPLVTAETKERIQRAVAETGFVMNAQGRKLAMGRAEAIAILVTEPLDEMFQDPTFASILRGVIEGLAGSLTLPLLLQAFTEDEHRRAIRHFERRTVDAVINISPYIGGDMLEALNAGSLPVVLCGQLDGQPYDGIFSSVYADDVVGATMAARRMMQRGRQRIAIIAGPTSNPAAADRVIGYRDTLGGLFDPRLTVSTGWDATSGFNAMRRLLERERGIDGVLAASDRIAVGALSALNAAGLEVPGDVSVIGFDDHLSVAATANPPLTTIHQPMLAEGKTAAQLALDMVGGAAARTVILEMTLIERGSV